MHTGRDELVLGYAFGGGIVAKAGEAVVRIGREVECQRGQTSAAMEEAVIQRGETRKVECQ